MVVTVSSSTSDELLVPDLFAIQPAFKTGNRLSAFWAAGEVNSIDFHMQAMA